MSHKRVPQRWLRLRIRLIGVLCLVFAAIVAARAYQLQVLQQEKFRRRASQQHLMRITLAPKRGVIYDRNHETLAISVPVESIYVNPAKLTDRKLAAKRLGKALGIAPRKLEKKFSSQLRFVWVKRQASTEAAERVRGLGIRGVGFLKENKRFYPKGYLAGPLLGFAGLDSQGLEGIERQYDHVLRANMEFVWTARDALGQRIVFDADEERPAEKMKNIVLTIDNAIQYIAEEELGRAAREHRTVWGTVLVMDPMSGEVLALAQQPRFDPNRFRRYKRSTWRARAVVDVFEPGSTFKIFLMAAALEEQTVRPPDVIYCEDGEYQIGGRTIHDAHAYGWLTVRDVLKYSSNIGASKIAERLGSSRFERYIRALGFGERTGIDFPGEGKGLLRPASRWKEIERSTIAYGQGISVTAVQIATALSAIANGGELLVPTFVKAIEDSDGRVTETRKKRVRRRVVSRLTAGTVRHMMSRVVVDGGTGEQAQIKGYRVAGKTGTAQKVNPKTKSYSRSRHIASFIGFVPADAPKLTIVVILDEPKPVPWGGVVAAPAFKRIAEKTLAVLGVPPYREAPPEETWRPLTVEAPRREKIRTQARHAPARTASARRASASPPLQRVPDFRGLTIREALARGNGIGLRIAVRGSGLAWSQELMPGSRIGGRDGMWIEFRPPN